MEDGIELPEYGAEQFRLADPPECDMIMKGGITSGIVYPYAVLEIATKYRFRAIGGTSAGAIAAAFAAAAEYARRDGRPEAFLTLKHYCDRLPDILPSLFQPDPALKPALDRVKAALDEGGRRRILLGFVGSGLAWGLAASAWFGALFFVSQAGPAAIALACMLGFVLGGLYGAFRAGSRWATPLIAGWSHLPGSNFGFCTGLSQGENGPQALTDWLHEAIQRIAFGDSGRDRPLTFGDLAGEGTSAPPIDLRIVTTNLSMRRPHTLPRLGMPAAFLPEEWRKLFPEPVMDHLLAVSEEWRDLKGAWSLPKERDLPVLVAVRMSLSFPLLFAAVPLRIDDTELPSIVRSLGGESGPRVRTALFSDGGLSSNFPIHMFDGPLPVRPTFAFSLEDLLADESEVKRRVALPDKAGEGMGVPVKEINGFADFAWQIISSAKDWQDQTLSEISGQRERIARIYLKPDEGGLNLDMPAEKSRRLMRWGFEAGRKFTDGSFDFDEHKWRRLLVLYKHLTANLDAIDAIWDEGFGEWYRSYLRHVESYKSLTLTDRRRIANELGALTDLRRKQVAEGVIRNADGKLPRKSGVWKVGPRY